MRQSVFGVQSLVCSPWCAVLGVSARQHRSGVQICSCDGGIRVNAIAPGPVWTPLNPADQPAQPVATFGSHTAMKRAAQPEEIAPAFVFMAAPSCSSYITGEILPIVGGY